MLVGRHRGPRRRELRHAVSQRARESLDVRARDRLAVGARHDPGDRCRARADPEGTRRTAHPPARAGRQRWARRQARRHAPAFPTVARERPSARRLTIEHGPAAEPLTGGERQWETRGARSALMNAASGPPSPTFSCVIGEPVLARRQAGERESPPASTADHCTAFDSRPPAHFCSSTGKQHERDVAYRLPRLVDDVAGHTACARR